MALIANARRAGVATALLACTACEPLTQPGAAVSVVLHADLAGTQAAMVVVEVTAADISSALVFNIPVVNNVASDTVTIPVGSDRTITIRAFDTGGVETHRGAVTVDIAPGTNPNLAVVLVPLTGEQPITATLGRVTITVTPATPTVAVGDTVTLSAAITDSNGNPVTGTVSWATRHPGIASVSATGVVTGVAKGQTTIVATYQGAAGSATVNVP